MPADRPAAHSEDLKAFAARCVATSEDEQAVLVDTQGPVSPKVYETLPIRKSNPLPVLTLGVMGIPNPAPNLETHLFTFHFSSTSRMQETVSLQERDSVFAGKNGMKK